jgi:hypothetical protein
MNNKQQGVFTMKTLTKLFRPLAMAVVAAALLAACRSMPLEEQIAVKEPGSWDFKSVSSERYIRIYDNPEKVGSILYEYGQKHPCNQGFQKMLKTTSPGLVQYAVDPALKSFACDEKQRYIFRTDANGIPYEGWISGVKDKEKKEFREMTSVVKYWELNNIKPMYIRLR